MSSQTAPSKPKPKGQDDDYLGNSPSIESIPYYADVVEKDPVLLSDEEMAKFIVDGFLVLKSDLPPAFHNAIFANGEAASGYGNPGNNILPAMPALQQVFDSPTVKGALKSILGENYLMHSHRHRHMNPPGFKGQTFHRDSYWGYTKPRSHVPRWVMLMYYPQDTPVELGPTAVFPASQYLTMPKAKDRRREKMPQAWGSQEVLLSCKAGTVVLINYDIWHRGTKNVSEKNRYMFKFQFTRMEEPTKPTWNNKSADWSAVAPALQLQRDLTPLWNYIWNWLCGRDFTANTGDKQAHSTSLLQMDLQKTGEDDEPARLNAAYTLAACAEEGAVVLNKAFTNMSAPEPITRNGAYGLTASGAFGTPFLAAALSSKAEFARCDAAFALGEQGRTASQFPGVIDGLLRARRDNSKFVRKNAVEALGAAAFFADAETARKVVGELVASLQKDQDEQVRFQSALSIARLAKNICGNPAYVASTIRALTQASLGDANRYTRFYCEAALERIGTTEAKDALIKLLWTARWDDLTTPDSQF